MTEAAEETTVPVPAPGSPGATLHRLREARNLSIAEVAQRLKYGQRQIEALERDDFDKLPGMTFVRGMIRGYARLLGADPETVLLELERQRVPDPMTVDLRVSRIPFPDGKKRTTRVYAALSVLLIAVATMMGYELLPWPAEADSGAAVAELPQSDKAESTPTIAPDIKVPASQAVLPPPQAAASLAVSAVPVISQVPALPPVIATGPVAALVAVPAPVAAPAGAASPGSKKIALQFDRESWVEIKQANGKTLLSQLNPGGSRQVVEGFPPFVLIIGNAPNVHLSYNDQPVDLRPHFKVDVARLTLE